MLCRLVLGLGMGGEWASGAALVAETWPEQYRARALALVQSSWAVGYALGAALVAVILPHFGWRAVFFAGVAPALIAFWVQQKLQEPEAWRKEKNTERADGPAVSRIAGPEHADLHHHERRDAVCVVGTVHLGSAFPVHYRVRRAAEG